MTLPVHMHVGSYRTHGPLIYVGVDDLALASPGTGSAACPYHSRVSFRNIVELAVTIYMQEYLRAFG